MYLKEDKIKRYHLISFNMDKIKSIYQKYIYHLYKNTHTHHTHRDV